MRTPATARDGRWSERDWTTGLAMVGVGLAAAAASLDNLRRLAVECGWDKSVAWLLPICLDLYGVTATRLWLRADTASEVRRWAAASGWLAVGLSVAGNALQHAIALNYLQDERGQTVLWAVIAVAAVPPVMLALLVHVEAMHRRAQLAAKATSPAMASEPPVGAAAAKDPDQRPPRRRRQRTANAQRSTVVRLLAEREDALERSAYQLGGLLAAEVGGHPQTVRRYVREWQQEQRSPATGPAPREVSELQGATG